MFTKYYQYIILDKLLRGRRYTDRVNGGRGAGQLVVCRCSSKAGDPRIGASSSSPSVLPSPIPMAFTSIVKSQSPPIHAFSSHPLCIPIFTSLPLLTSRTRCPPSLTLNRSPIVRSSYTNTSPDYTPAPHTNFYKVEAILRPWRIPQVSSALLKMGIRGVTVSDVRGFGAQGGSTERLAGSEFSEDNFIAKVKMEIVVCKDQVEEVIQKIIEEARTGEIGDGKIFVIPVSDIIRVRTGERGERAERMAGGRADMSSSSS